VPQTERLLDGSDGEVYECYTIVPLASACDG